MGFYLYALFFAVLYIYCYQYSVQGICNINDQAFDSVLNSLRDSGYIIEKGYLEWKFNKSSYGANPSFVYGIYNFERIEFNERNQYMDTAGPDGNDNNNNDNALDRKRKISIRSHQDIDNFWFMYGATAVLFYGCLPPSSHYFSYRSYVNRRYNPGNTTNFTAKYFPEENPYGSLGDMLNHKRINHTFNPQLNRNVSLVISTGDQVSFDEIKNVFYAQNNSPYYQSIMNLDAIPNQWIEYKEDDWYQQLLDGGTVDSIGIMFRSFNKPIWNVSYSDFIQYFNQNQSIYKLYPKSSKNSIPRKAYNTEDAVIFNDNQTTIIPNERNSSLSTYYEQYIEALISFMTSNRWQYRSTKIGVPFYKGRIGYGYECIEWGTRCLADNRDCMYFMTWPDVSYLSNDNLTVQFIIGVVHPDNNICEWGSIVPYFAQPGIPEYLTKENYRANKLVKMDDEYRYSSLSFPPNINKTIPHEALNKMFIISAMRPGTVQNYEYFNMTPSFIITTDKLPYRYGYTPFHRCYINDITKTRPPEQNMIPMTVVEFLKY